MSKGLLAYSLVVMFICASLGFISYQYQLINCYEAKILNQNEEITMLKNAVAERESDIKSISVMFENTSESYLNLSQRYSMQSSEVESLSSELEDITHTLNESLRYGGLIEFKSDTELWKWLYANDVSTREFKEPSYVCSDFARDLCLDAISEGYLMGLSRISDERHQRCFTIIGKDIYEIEAITDGIKVVGRVY